MGECDYLNARVRAMGAELFSRELFEQMLGTDSGTLPMDALLASPYGGVLRESLAEHAGIAAIERALRRDLVRCFSRVRSMAPPGARALLDTQLARWDLQNVLAVLRGVSARAAAREITAALLPAGAFPEAQLADLAASPDPVSLARKLATWNYPFAFELHDALLARRGPPEKRMFAAYFRWALSVEASSAEDRRIVRSLVTRQIDLANIKSALQVVHSRGSKDAPARAAAQSQPVEWIPGGLLKKRFLERLAGSPNLEAAFGALDETYFAPAIEKGILAYGESRSLGVMERFLEELVIQAGCRLYRGDLLSIAVPVGYLWKKYNETVNLRALCRGIAAHVPANTIRKELLLV
ncbi:MAG: V-type ATPase subunit [Spirochaetia bacterium]|jgi:vacuolar-type H+-ATPase subunit C/Vma6